MSSERRSTGRGPRRAGTCRFGEVQLAGPDLLRPGASRADREWGHVRLHRRRRYGSRWAPSRCCSDSSSWWAPSQSMFRGEIPTGPDRPPTAPTGWTPGTDENSLCGTGGLRRPRPPLPRDSGHGSGRARCPSASAPTSVLDPRLVHRGQLSLGELSADAVVPATDQMPSSGHHPARLAVNPGRDWPMGGIASGSASRRRGGCGESDRVPPPRSSTRN